MDHTQGLAFGKATLAHFDFGPGHRNLNHGSFGGAPRHIRKYMKEHQDLCEATPDRYIRYDYPIILDECREAMARFINAPTDTVVFVPNATTGVNTVLHNLVWADDGKDVIVSFSTVYGSVGKIIDYTVDSSHGKVSSRTIEITYPCEDEVIVQTFHTTLNDIKNTGKRARVCVFDTVSSLPAARFPFEAMTNACRDSGVLSLVDGAQGVGMLPLDLARLDPDFFVSNCHKWLFVPRSCAVFYVPLRNQHLTTSTMPTSHGYVPLSGSRFNPLPPSRKPPFVNNFEFIGTLDASAYVCVKEAIKWRQTVLGGEARIMGYLQNLAREGGQEVALILGTKVLDNESQTISQCPMINVALPLDAKVATIETQDWMLRTMVGHYNTFIPMIIHAGRLWARLSAQVYLDTDDFKWVGHMLLELCERVKRGEASER